MNQQTIDNLSRAGKQAYDLALQVGELNVNTLDSLTSNQLGVWGDTLQKGFDQLQRLHQARTYQDAVSVQLEAAQDLARSAVDGSRQTVDVLTGARDKYLEVWHKGVAQAAAEVEKAAPKAAV